MSEATANLHDQFKTFRGQIAKLLADAEQRAERSMLGDAYVLNDAGDILSLPRDNGDSRYPYGYDGFNLWVYSSGYLHANEGLLSPFLRASQGQEPNVAFFATLPGEAETRHVAPLLAVPRVLSPLENKLQRQCVFRSTAAYFLTQLEDLNFGLRIFATKQREIIFSLTVANEGKSAQKLQLSSYLNPFLRNQLHPSDEDKWFKQVELLDQARTDGGLAPFLMTVHEDKDRHTTTTNHALLRRELTLEGGAKATALQHTTSRNAYVGGSRSSLHTPEALLNGRFENAQPLCTFTENAIMGDLIDLELPAGSTARIDMVFARAEAEETLPPEASQALDPKAIDATLAKLDIEETRTQAPLSLHVSGSEDERLKTEALNAFFVHLKKQVEFCSLIKGYIQLAINSLIGIRDVFQAIEGLLFWQPKAARAKMIEALGFTCPDGRTFRQYSLPPANRAVGRMDLRQFIDQGVWVISTVWTYLKVTDDWDFLKTECGYHEIVNEAAGEVRKSTQKDSVLEHLVKIMDYLLANCDHSGTECTYALYGDWNDALDGLGISKDGSKEFGTGVSVMATLQVYQNTLEMAALLECLDKSAYADRIKAYREAGERIENGLLKHAVVSKDDASRILHGWGDAYSYLVGSYNDPDGQARDGLTSNAFWVLSGLYGRHPAFKTIILDALERLDDKYGYRTFAPAFPMNTKGVGRIPKLPAGTAENGATYVHATAFAVMALFQMGEAKEAWEQLIKILPFTPGHENLTHSPFVMPNSYGHNPEKGIDGQNMNDWQTGSSNVVLKLLIRFVFGVEPAIGGVWIQPAAWSPFKQFDFSLPVHGAELRLSYRNDGKGKRTFTVNGKPAATETDTIMGLEKLWLSSEQLPKGGSVDITITD